MQRQSFKTSNIRQDDLRFVGSGDDHLFDGVLPAVRNTSQDPLYRPLVRMLQATSPIIGKVANGAEEIHSVHGHSTLPTAGVIRTLYQV